MKILIVSSSRADWGLLAPVLAELKRIADFDVELAVTGEHLATDSPSLRLIQQEGVNVDHRIEMGLSDDSPCAIAHAMGSVVGGMGEVLSKASPDLVLVLGDRYEILCIVAAALVARIAVAHLCGGDVTEGAMDDSIRHAVTKMSSLHFVTNSASARRVGQLGEAPERIFTVGSPGLDRILQIPVMKREAFLVDVGLSPSASFFVVTYHPPTLSEDVMSGCRAMLEALRQFPDRALILTGSNADPGGRAIDNALRRFAAETPNAVFHDSLGSLRYFSALAYADAVIGNSSSGLYEAPSFRLPTVNIGDRQKGRCRASSVIDCEAETGEIVTAIRKALKMDCSSTVNPFGEGDAARRIAEVLKNISDPNLLVRKTFQDQC